MINKFIESAREGNPVYISTVSEAFLELKEEDKHTIICELSLIGENRINLYTIHLPNLKNLENDEINFIKSYIWAEIYNILSCQGGRYMNIYIDNNNNRLLELVNELNDVFCIDGIRSKRVGYGKAINVIDRMLNAITTNKQAFKFNLLDISEYVEVPKINDYQPGDSKVFTRVAQEIDDKIICGMDIGGTDIKTVLVKDGKIEGYKEYDWFPASFTESKQLIEPIYLIIRLMRAKISYDLFQSKHDNVNELADALNKALDKEATDEFMLTVIEKVEAALKNELIDLDSIGLCFPDVVVKNKIVGGEVYKTRGIRNNPNIEYEADFLQLTNLNNRLKALIKVNGSVNIINDGPMASFTAAVEIAADKGIEAVKHGVFAHTLGTELGTGWVDGKGVIPDIPLEVYNFIIDLGSFVEKQYPSDDLRSINNFNTELSGTLQKYCSQSGVFRLAMKYFPELRPDLYQELFEKGFVVKKMVDGLEGYYVPTEPTDMRKPFLEHMMSLPERESDHVNEKIWRDVGECLAITGIESDKILNQHISNRVLFGRLVKNNRCFDLIREGAQKINPLCQFEVANADMANTSLMRQLEDNEEFTVAQFAQAVGAVYYGNSGLIKD